MSGEEKPVSLIGTIKVPITLQGSEKDFTVHVSPPGPMENLENLEKALEQNRALLNECQKDMYENMKKDFFEYQPPWMINYEGPIQTAVMARHNINVLIPLVNVKGGRATYSKIETMPVKTHVEKLMFKAEKAALEWQVEKSSPIMYAVAVAMVVAVVVIAFVLI
ncbi:MAG: Unknown protein [uncultured Thiotrichaceae bacterium]|uniref:Uncharacterized protein n=1 Tax=uncultured Thiotrichaceae bacterium TaxID=298394 RepID=A0A6S6TW15_9GAMM|nr:MAG: Unknown protein [uncultured Thiotrichaceae bacterium]